MGITVGEIRKAIEGLPDEAFVGLSIEFDVGGDDIDVELEGVRRDGDCVRIDVKVVELDDEDEDWDDEDDEEPDDLDDLDDDTPARLDPLPGQMGLPGMGGPSDHECKVCGATPDEEGYVRHGKGCYAISEEGGGEEYVGGPASRTTTTEGE